MDGSPDQPRTDGSNASIVYMVSIYLLLIAFFVILHTVSKKEAVKAAAVVGSVRVTFQRPEKQAEDLPQDTGQPKFSGPNKEFRDHVVGLFGSFINSSRFSKIEQGNVLRVGTDPNEFFYRGTSTLRADRLDLMRGMADMITNPQPYRRNRIEIWVEAGEHTGAPAGKQLEIRRAGALARDLVKHDVDPHQVTIGIVPGKGHRLFMTFAADQLGGGEDSGGEGSDHE